MHYLQTLMNAGVTHVKVPRRARISLDPPATRALLVTKCVPPDCVS